MTIGLKVIYVQSFVLNPWSSWPFQAFPANEFKTWDQQRLIRARNAWGFFESVEALDAQVRIRLSGKPILGRSMVGDPDLWYNLKREPTLHSQYKYGQYLHTLVCPEILWDGQRHLEFPRTPVTTLTLTMTVPFPVNPSSVEALPDNQSAIVLWPAPTSATPIVSYTVTSTPGSITSTTSNLSTIVRGLTNGTSYRFTVTSKDAFGFESAPSVQSNAVVPRTNPTQPTITSATDGLESAILNWTAPSNNGGGAITNYTIISDPGDIYATSTGLSGVITGLEPGFTYTFTVTATNSWDLDSLPSNPSGPVIPLKIPDAPTNVVGVPGPSSVILTWTGTYDYAGVRYSVQTKTTTGMVVTGLGGVTNIASTTTTVTGLVNGTSYVFTVTAYITLGPSVASLPSNIVTPTGVPFAPVIAASYGDFGYPLLSWPLPNSNGSLITGYTAYVYNDSNSLVGTYSPTPPTRRYITLSELTYGSTYTCKVTATNVVGESAQSNTVTVIPADVPGAPLTVSATTAYRTVHTPVGSANVFWSPPPSNGSAITGYTITPYAGIRPVGSVTAGPTDSSVAVMTLNNGTAYTFVVYATNVRGTSVASANSNPVTPISVPSAPFLISSTVDDGTVSIKWRAPTSTGGSPITGYRVTRSPPGSVVTVTGTTYDISGLVNGTSYMFSVAAVNIAGNGTIATFSPIIPAGAPGVPSDVSGSLGNTTATISWNPPANLNGGTLRGYIVSINSQQSQITLDASITSYTYSNLVNGVSYILSVNAVSNVGVSPIVSVTVIPGRTPGPPTGLTAAYAGSGGVLLNWVAPVDSGTGTEPVNRYRITYNSLVYDISSSTTFTATGLTNGTPYTFNVTSINIVNLISSPATIQWTPAGGPDAPTSVTATAGIRTASLSWTVPNNNGSAISGYTVTVSSSNGGSLGTVGTISGTSCNITGLTNGGIYTFSVTATNEAGTSTAGLSNQITLANAPSQPSSVTATAGIRSASLSWTAPNNNGSAISGYTVTVSSSNGGSLGTVGTISGTSCNITGLTNGGIYTFSVTATNGAGTSAAGTSNTISLASPPNAPSSINATAGIRSASLSWTAPDNNGSAITSYTVTVSSSNGGSLGTVVTISGTSCTVTGLTNGGIYTFSVTATNGAGTSTAGTSNTISLASPPNAPTSVTATAGIGSASLSWPAPNDNGSAITSYTVTVSSSNGGSLGTVVTISGTSCTVTGLTNGGIYTFSVTATNGAGTGPARTSNTITLAGVPSAPTSIAATIEIGTSTITWNPPSNNGGSPISFYTLRITGGSYNGFSNPVTSGITISGLSNYTQYTFYVKATNAAGLESPEGSVTITMPGNPTQPNNLSVVAGDSSVQVNWGVPANNGGSAITTYYIRVLRGGSILNTINTQSTSLSYTVTGLTNGVVYNFSVAAANIVGIGDYSSETSQVVPVPAATVPGTPNITSVTRGDTEVTVNWSAPSSNGSAITTYYIQPYAAGSLFNIISTASTATSYTVPGLTNGTSYTFSVAAVNGVGTGSYSSQSSSVTPAGLPGTPSTPTTTAGDTQVTVNWSAPSSNGSAITGYSIVVFSNFSVIRTVTSGSTSVIVTGLTNGTSYAFQVAAVNGVGRGADSPLTPLVTPINSLPDPPNIVSGIFVEARYLDNGDFYDKRLGTGNSITAPTNTGGSAIKYYTTFCIHAGVLRSPSDAITEAVPSYASIYLSYYTPNGNFYVTATNTAGYTSLPRICNLDTPFPQNISIGTDSSLSYSSPVNISSITHSDNMYPNGTWSNSFGVNFTPIPNMLYYTVIMDGLFGYPLRGNGYSYFGATTPPIYINFTSNGRLTSGYGPFTFRISCTNANISTSKLSAPFTFSIP